MKNRVMLILFVSLIMASFIFAENPRTIVTFNSIGIYWNPSRAKDDRVVSVEYRKNSKGDWIDGLEMKWRPISGTKAELAIYRGSIVNLEAGAEYQIKLSLKKGKKVYQKSGSFTVTTWKEVKKLREKQMTTPKVQTRGKGSKKYNKKYTIKTSGTKSGRTYIYKVYDGKKLGKTIDVKGKQSYCIHIKKNTHHIIIRNFTLKGAKKDAILIEDKCQDIIIENCDISKWGRKSKKDKYAYQHDAGIKADGTNIEKIIVQRCRIHDPNYGANSWAEKNKNNKQSQIYHPRGAQAIVFYKSKGNHVIRYNEFYSKKNMFNDIIGADGNASYVGFPTADTDIYGNYLSGCYDDAIEVEGADRNVRVWGNYFENFYVGIGNAPVTVGPLYVWENTSGKSLTVLDKEGNPSTEGAYGQFIKMATTSGNYNKMKGYTYIFNNTILQPKNNGAGGIGTKEDHQRQVKYCIARNNILHVRYGCKHSLFTKKEETFTYDHNLWSAGHPEGKNKKPKYKSRAKIKIKHSGSKPIIADFFLKKRSPGYRGGVSIPNFAPSSKPDMGAFQYKQERQYGVNAYRTGANKVVAETETTVNLKWELSPNYPNPFNPSTNISFTVPQASNVKIVVYDMLGREVAKVVDNFYESGSYNQSWMAKDKNGTQLASGIYIARIQAGSFTKSIKMMLLR